jgi:excisionase family DNA binding protein
MKEFEDRNGKSAVKDPPAATLDDVFKVLRGIRADLRAGGAGLLTAKEAARFLGIGRSTLYRLATTDKMLQPVRIGPAKTRRWRRTDLQAWLDRLDK